MDYQTEALETIKEMTTHLLYLGVGVFALVGGYLSGSTATFKGKWTKGVLLTSLALFGASLLAGLILFTRLIDLLQSNQFELLDRCLLWSSGIQIGSIFFGCIFFYVFMVLRIVGCRGKAEPD